MFYGMNTFNTLLNTVLVTISVEIFEVEQIIEMVPGVQSAVHVQRRPL